MLTVTKDPRTTPSLAAFQIAGSIDDLCDFGPIHHCPEPEILLNFDKVTSINSYGVRKLMQLVAALKGKKLTYEDCRPHMITQINMIPTLSGGVTITTFYLPLECDSCDQEIERSEEHTSELQSH